MLQDETPQSYLGPLLAENDAKFDAAVIVPMRNASAYIKDSLDSVVAQTNVDLSKIELVMYDDDSTDETVGIVFALIESCLRKKLGRVKLIEGTNGPHGCGSARNRAIEESTANILLFLDSDDIMTPNRVKRTLDAFCSNKVDVNEPGEPRLSGLNHTRHDPVGVVGGNFQRIPLGSTPRYESYHRRINGTTNSDTELFPYAFRDAPLAMPTVACLRQVWKEAGKFAEGPRISEDLIFQYKAMEIGYALLKLGGEPLVQYRFHSAMSSSLLSQKHMLQIRVAAFEKLVLLKRNWTSFCIWGAGRDGKGVFRLLSEEGKKRMVCWGDINPRKIGLPLHGKPVVHFRHLKPPIAACVALDRTNGQFEDNLHEKHLTPGRDYVFLI